MRGRFLNYSFDQRRAFTLVELLVVTSIIGLLLALLLPMVGRAREQSKRVVCQKNLHDIWNGIVVYSTEFNDRIPYLEQGKPGADPFDPANTQMVGTVLGPYVASWAFICPSAVAGYPETDPSSSRKWKLTYDFSTADRVGSPVAYDDAPGAFTGQYPDPAVVNMFHFDGRPMRTLSLPKPQRPATSPSSSGSKSGSSVEIIDSTTVPLVSDTLGIAKHGGASGGRPIYPHRGVIRRQSAYYRRMALGSDPRLVSNRTHGYLQLHVVRRQPEIILTRYTRP